MAMVFLKVQTILTKMDRKIIYYINQSLSIFKRLVFKYFRTSISTDKMFA